MVIIMDKKQVMDDFLIIVEEINRWTERAEALFDYRTTEQYAEWIYDMIRIANRHNINVEDLRHKYKSDYEALGINMEVYLFKELRAKLIE